MRFNQRIQALPILFGMGAFLATGCGGSQEDHAGHDHASHDHEQVADEGMDADGMAVTSRENTLTKIFHAAPSPMETASLIKRSGAHFHSDALNGANRALHFIIGAACSASAAALPVAAPEVSASVVSICDGNDQHRASAPERQR